MVDSRWKIVDGRWQMVDGRWQMVDGTMVGYYIYTMNNLSFDFNKPVSNYKFTSNQKEAFINNWSFS